MGVMQDIQNVARFRASSKAKVPYVHCKYVSFFDKAAKDDYYISMSTDPEPILAKRLNKRQWSAYLASKKLWKRGRMLSRHNHPSRTCV